VLPEGLRTKDEAQEVGKFGLEIKTTGISMCSKRAGSVLLMSFQRVFEYCVLATYVIHRPPITFFTPLVVVPGLTHSVRFPRFCDFDRLSNDDV
jgi:hypothetical protein